MSHRQPLLIEACRDSHWGDASISEVVIHISEVLVTDMLSDTSIFLQIPKDLTRLRSSPGWIKQLSSRFLVLSEVHFIVCRSHSQHYAFQFMHTSHICTPVWPISSVLSSCCRYQCWITLTGRTSPMSSMAFLWPVSKKLRTAETVAATHAFSALDYGESYLEHPFCSFLTYLSFKPMVFIWARTWQCFPCINCASSA